MTPGGRPEGADQVVRPVARVAVQAHRGSPDPAAGILENTLEAFDRARRLGADGVELDVRLTADVALAVHHDAEIPGVGPVAGLAVRDLPDHVPLLGEVLDACRGMTVNVEVKNVPTEPSFDPDDLAAREVAALVGSLLSADELSAGEPGGPIGAPFEGVVVSSFWPPALRAVADAEPRLPTGLLLASWADPEWGVATALDLGCRALHPEQSLVTPALMAEAHAAGLAVVVWTVNDPARVTALAGLGVGTVITDDVPAAVEALRGAPGVAPAPGSGSPPA